MSSLYKYIDHTNLSVTATSKDIQKLIKEASKYGTASVCIPPCYVAEAKKYIEENSLGVKICTVIGFPNGNTSTEAKVAEAQQAYKDGADEIDMVINVGKLKEGDYDYVKSEIKKLDCISHGIVPEKDYHILKVIIETCLLTEAEIRKMCHICAEAGADYIKTSTGFNKEGANRKVVGYMLDEIQKSDLKLKVKAAGGIKTIDDMYWYVNQGVSRLGTSSGVKIIEASK